MALSSGPFPLVWDASNHTTLHMYDICLQYLAGQTYSLPLSCLHVREAREVSLFRKTPGYPLNTEFYSN